MTAIRRLGSARADRAVHSHALIFAALSLLTVIAWRLVGAHATLWVEIGIVAACVALLGIPHGALDYQLLRTLGKRHRNPLVFPAALAAYVLLAGLVIALWIAFPALMLGAFLLASVVHFGIEDNRTHPAWSLRYVSELVLRGTLPILLPVTLHPAETTWVFAQLVPLESAQWLTDHIAGSWPLLPGLALVLLATSAPRGRRTGLAQWPTYLELCSVTVLFAATPPLVAFAVYFGILHSARHLIRCARRSPPGSITKNIATLARHALPMSAMTWALAIAAVVLYPPDAIGTQLTLQVLFIGLAALTFPHAALLIGMRVVEANPAGRLPAMPRSR